MSECIVEGGFSCRVNLFFFLFFVFLLLGLSSKVRGKHSQQCDLFNGTWITDEAYPLYQDATCPFLQQGFTCQGRPDLNYTHYRWQPLACNLRKFDGRDFLEKVRGKTIMFVGDSISLNQWQSLTCMLHSAVPTSNYTLTRLHDVATFTFTEYNVKVMVDKNLYLVDIVEEKIGRVLKLDSIEESSKLWEGVDMLIFNTWHWWNRRAPASVPWDYIQSGTQVLKDMDRMKAFEEALKTWGAWVDATVDPTKVKVFFQGTSPYHPGCIGQTTPVPGSTYPEGLPPAVAVLKSVLRIIKKPVTLLDITTLSLLRKDGHPSIYSPAGGDCVHWCLPGVPDTWNEIFYNLI